MQLFFVDYECAKKEIFLATPPSLHNSNMSEWILFRLAKRKKNPISADNKHEKFQMKGFFFFLKNTMSMGEQQVKTEVSVQP